jgi:hypothetical protein
MERQATVKAVLQPNTATNNYNTRPRPPLEGLDRGEGGPNFALTLALSRGGRGNILNAKILFRRKCHVLRDHIFPIARRIFSGEIGSDLTRTPSASYTAFPMAGATVTMEVCDMPFEPNGPGPSSFSNIEE